MRPVLLVTVLLLVGMAPAHAAWVWVYGGEQHVLLPPEEGRPPWADFADANADGTPDPIITKIELRVEDDEGEPIGRVRLGRTVHLVAVPELGGMELEPLGVTWRLVGPVGAVEVTPEEALGQAAVLGTAPPVFRASYTLPEPPSREFAGDWSVSVEVRVGSASFDTATTTPLALKVLGPRETMPEKVGREVSGGLKGAGREVKEFGEKVAGEIEAWLAAHKKEPLPGALKPVPPRETLGMVERVLRAEGSPPAREAELLAANRATARRSRLGPHRSLLVIPYDRAVTPEEEYRLPVGWVVVEGVRPPGVVDLQAVLPWSYGSGVRAGRVLLEAEPGSAEGNVHLEASDGTPFLTLPARVEWFGRVLWPGETELRVQRHPTPEGDGLVDIRIVSAVPGGAARVDFTLPLVEAEQLPTPASETPTVEPPSTEATTEPT